MAPTILSRKEKTTQGITKTVIKAKLARSKHPQMLYVSSIKEKHITAAPITLKELHDQVSGQLDAAKIAGVLGLSVTGFANALGRPVATIHKNPASKDVQDDLGPIASVITILSTLLKKPEYVRMWLHSPNPELGYETAMSLITSGKAAKVRDLLNSALSGQIT
jgi:hypothetical protein